MSGDPGAVGGIVGECAGPGGGDPEVGSGRGWYQVGAARDSGKISGPGFSVDVRRVWVGGVSPEK